MILHGCRNWKRNKFIDETKTLLDSFACDHCIRALQPSAKTRSVRFFFQPNCWGDHFVTYANRDGYDNLHADSRTYEHTHADSDIRSNVDSNPHSHADPNP